MTIRLHYDQHNKEIRKVDVLSEKIVDEYYKATNKGMLFSAELFPLEMLPKLESHLERVKQAELALNNTKGEIYKLANEARKIIEEETK